ncbi:hypothetical protein RUM44_012466 [Polyplax serrata]|uniref:Major facilitator superfamily (MFS) profile domain-containing protein n=1 Tax=Polyplax serrata TaxID=468196 RepID=A0ABR1BF67_POLSC
MSTSAAKDRGGSGSVSCRESTKCEESDSEDVVSRIIGDYGKWQLQLTFFLALFNLPCTWHIYAMTFQAPEVNFWCSPPEGLEWLPPDLWRNISHTPPLSHNPKARDNPCQIWNVNYTNFTYDELVNADFAHKNIGVRNCDKWSYGESEIDETMVSQWNLVCDKSTLKDTAEMVFLAGVAIGGLISGIISDRFGRKKTLMTSLMLQIIVGVIIAFVPWFEVFLVLRCLLGFISVSVVFSGFVLCMELVGGKWRTVSGVSYLFPVPLSYIAFAGIAYFIRDWKQIQLAITLPAVLLLGLWWILPESPRWLLAMGRIEENVEILKEAAKTNKRTVVQNIDKSLRQSSAEEETDEKENVGIIDLFRYPNIRKKSLLLYVIWFSVYFVYYGLVMNLTNIGGDIYVNTIISGLVEIPAIALSILILLKMGRRWPLCLTLLGSGIACLLTLPFGEDREVLTITLAMFGKFAISSSNAIAPVYTAELFPTVVRNLGVGSSNVAAGVALVLVPYLWNLAAIDFRFPMGLLGSFGVVGGISVLFLEETANRPMLNTLKEGENL